MKKKPTKDEIIRDLRRRLSEEQAINKQLVSKVEYLEFELWSERYVAHRAAGRASWGAVQ